MRCYISPAEVLAATQSTLAFGSCGATFPSQKAIACCLPLQKMSPSPLPRRVAVGPTWGHTEPCRSQRVGELPQNWPKSHHPKMGPTPGPWVPLGEHLAVTTGTTSPIYTPQITQSHVSSTHKPPITAVWSCKAKVTFPVTAQANQ